MSPKPPPDDACARLLPPDVPESHPHPRAIEVHNGVVWSLLGRCDLAWEWWEACDVDELQPWIMAEQGRVLRELGLHLDAESYDAEGLVLARDPIDAATLRIGLVADAVGRGDSRLCNQRLGVATHDVENLQDGPRTARQRIRLAWVEVEVALLTNREPMLFGLPAAGEDATIDFPPDFEHGSDFHRAKGLLFGGIARHEPRLLDAALELSPPMLTWAIHLARADFGVEGALDEAKRAWKEITPPPPYAEDVANGPTGTQLVS